MRPSPLLRICLVAVLMGPAGPLAASPDVMPDAPILGSPFTVVEGLEILRSRGCLPDMMTGDGILAQDEVARLLTEVGGCAPAPEDPLLREMMGRLSGLYPPQTAKEWYEVQVGRPVLGGQYFYFRDDRRVVIPTTNIDALTGPWTAYRKGVPFAGGSNGLGSVRLGASIGRWLDLAAEPQFLANRDDATQPRLPAGQVKLTATNFEAKTGRVPLLWGQGPDGQVIFSDNARPLDLVQIGNPHPFKLPWILRYLGPFQYRVVFARLNQAVAVPDPYLLGFRLMIKPHSSIEIGLTRVILLGGTGAPGFDWWEPMAELAGIRIKEGFIWNIPIKPRGTSTGGFANNVSALDLRWRIEALRGTELCFEMYEEDPLDFQDFFPQDTIFHAGFWIPRLNDGGTWQLLVDGTHAADIVYSHHIFRSGFTQNRRLIGSDVGFASDEFRVRLTRIILPRLKLWGSYGMRFHSIPFQDSPTEQRILGRAGGTVSWGGHWQASVEGGLQQAANYEFVADRDRTFFMSATELKYSW